MTSIKPFQATDLFEHNAINLDPLTENFYIYFYLHYLANFPSICYQSTSTLDKPTGYMLAKTEGSKKEWHAHISAVTVDPHYRRIGLGSDLCDILKVISETERPIHAWFIDLFVKCSNKSAITLYEKLGYSVFRRVVAYYDSANENPERKIGHDDMDAFDMRLALKRDTNKETVRADGKKVLVLPDEVVFH